jgi:hypothetical protein
LTPRTVDLPDQRVWLRIADPAWANPLGQHSLKSRGTGGMHRVRTQRFASMQMSSQHACRSNECAQARPSPRKISQTTHILSSRQQLPPTSARRMSSGVEAVGLPTTYPLDDEGKSVPHQRCRPIGQLLFDAGLNGVWCRSACSEDGRGRELAWFARSQMATTLWDQPLPFGRWRYADEWSDLALPNQVNPG